MPRSIPLRRKLRARLMPPVVRLLATLVRPLPWGLVQWVGRCLGDCGWVLARRDRRRILDSLRRAFPDLEEDERRRLGRESLRHNCVNVLEVLHLSGKSCERIGSLLRVEGWEHVEAHRGRGRPLLFLTAHCGNWELLSPAVNCRGGGLVALAREVRDPWAHELVVDFRRAFGTETLERRSAASARHLLRVLRGSGSLAVLIDQDTRVEGVWVPFFGRPARTPVSAAHIALRHGAVVIPAFLERLPDGTHVARFHSPLDLPDDEREATAVMTAVIEAQVRRRPEQWVWMHKRWRRQVGGRWSTREV